MFNDFGVKTHPFGQHVPVLYLTYVSTPLGQPPKENNEKMVPPFVSPPQDKKMRKCPPPQKKKTE